MIEGGHIVTIQEINKAAREAGMSYGQYVDTHKESPELQEVPPPPDARASKICPVCGKEFYTRKGQNRKLYCSDACKAKVKKKGPDDIIRQLEEENRALKTELAVNANKSQEAKADAGKVRPTLVPLKIIWAIAAVREFGTAKYGDPDNWKKVEPQRYKDAMARHMLSYLAGPHDKDPESGLSHLWHIACNVAFLCELEDENS